jgi:hypothetical protein
MPIRPGEKARYPKEWAVISLWMRVCAGWRCEWCDAIQGAPHPVTQSRVVLTVAHMDHTPENCTPGNLAALCQRCHLRYDAQHHKETRTRIKDMFCV